MYQTAFLKYTSDGFVFVEISMITNPAEVPQASAFTILVQILEDVKHNGDHCFGPHVNMARITIPQLIIGLLTPQLTAQVAA
jgi:hypothetical protein